MVRTTWRFLLAVPLLGCMPGLVSKLWTMSGRKYKMMSWRPYGSPVRYRIDEAIELVGKVRDLLQEGAGSPSCCGDVEASPVQGERNGMRR
jgi:hypothetical protein